VANFAVSKGWIHWRVLERKVAATSGWHNAPITKAIGASNARCKPTESITDSIWCLHVHSFDPAIICAQATSAAITWQTASAQRQRHRPIKVSGAQLCARYTK